MNNQQPYDYLLQQIDFVQGNSRIEKINKGYSTDQKFMVEKNSELYLLKCFALEELVAKQKEFEAMNQMQQLQVHCSRPVTIGTLPDAGIGYMVLTYMVGEEASDGLPRCTLETQYEIGLRAGTELANMHQWIEPNAGSDWYDRKLAKHQAYMEQYLNLHSEYRLNEDEAVLRFINRHLPLMKNRPNVFLHGDYHVGNLIVKDNQFAGVIDFNRMGWGDPVHDFFKAGLFSSEVSIPFTIAQIKAYHGNQDPDEQFWTLYSLYMAMSIVSSVVWILKVKTEEFEIMKAKLERVLADHNHFNSIIPSWYLKEHTR